MNRWEIINVHWSQELHTLYLHVKFVFYPRGINFADISSVIFMSALKEVLFQLAYFLH